jgi:hypothetical protein
MENESHDLSSGYYKSQRDATGKRDAVILSSAENSRSVYQVSVTASDTEQAKTVVALILCPDPDHAPPCPVRWESRSSKAGGSVDFVLYATDGQAQKILDQPSSNNSR